MCVVKLITACPCMCTTRSVINVYEVSLFDIHIDDKVKNIYIYIYTLNDY